MKLDFKKLKKVSSDKNKTILQHPKGHQIMVAHKGLTKANLEALSKLPAMYKNPANVEENTPAYFPNFAEGGDVEEEGIAKGFGGVKHKIVEWAEEGKTKRQLEAEKYMANPKLGRPEQDLPEETKGHYADGGAVKRTQKYFPYVKESQGQAPSNMPGEPTAQAAQNYADFAESHPEYKKAAFPPEVQEYYQQGKIQQLEKPIDFKIRKAKPETVAAAEPTRAPATEQPIEPATPEEKAAAKKAIMQTRQAEAVPSAAAPEAAPADEAATEEDTGPITPALPNVPLPESVVPKEVSPAVKSDVFAPAYESKLKAAQLAEKSALQRGQADVALSQEAFKAQDIYQSRLNMIAAEQQKTLNDQQAERQKLREDINKNLIDPNRVIRNMSTGNKILAGISLILGGIGSGLTGQPNMAYQVIKDAIDKDVDAQAKNLGVRDNMLSKDMAYYKDILDAKKNLAGTYLDMTNHILERAKAANLPYQRIADITAVQSKIMEDLSSFDKDIALRQALKKAQMMGGAGGVRETTAILRTLGPEGAKIAEDMEKKYVPGVGMAVKEVPTDILSKMTARETLHKKLVELDEFAKKHGGTLLNQATIREGTALARSVQDLYRQANEQGVFKEPEKEFVNSIIGDKPTGIFSSWMTRPGYKAAIKSNLTNLNDLYGSYGLPPHQEGAAPGKEAAAPAKEAMPPPPAGQVYMIAPDGKTIGTIPKENVQKALQRGFKAYKGQ